MKRFKVVLLLMLTSGATAFSNVANAKLGDKSCEFLFSPVRTVALNGRTIEIELTDDPSQPDGIPYAKFLANASKNFPAEILAMYAKIASYMAVPSKTLLRLTPGLLMSDNATSSAPIIHMGVARGTAIISRKETVEAYWKHPNYSIPILRHETGHILFNHNLAIDRPEFARFFKTFQDAHRIILTAQNLEKKLNILNEFIELKKNDEQTVSYIKQEIESVKLALAGMDLTWAKTEYEFGQPYESLFQRAVAYQEFFADVVSVVFSDDANAVKDAIPVLTPVTVFSVKDPTKKERKKLAEQVRARQQAAAVENLLRGFEVHVREGTLARGEHGVLWQVRKHVWQHYLSTPTQRERNGMAVIAGVYRALLAEVDWLEQNPGFQPLRNQSEANAHVIEAIDRELKR